jgi:hypothetical protein
VSEPKVIGIEFAEVLRNPPVFGPCSECGERTSGAICFDCDRRRLLSIESREQTLAGIPAWFQWAMLEAPELLTRVRGNGPLIARARMASDATRVVLEGPSGSGKTSLACAMLRAWAAKRAQVARIILATDLASARNRHRLGSESPTVLDALEAPLLVLDDLGTEKDAPNSALVEVVFHRHAHAKPTWVTTWLTHEQRVNRYGEGFARRLVDGARIIDCGG